MDKNLCFDEIKGLSTSKIVYYVDQSFKSYFRKIIQEILKFNAEIPVNWEDLYYEFLYEIPDYIAEFDEIKNISFTTYLALKCRFYTKNTVRKYKYSSFKILNSCVSLESLDFVPSLDVEPIDDKLTLNLDCLSEFEQKLFYEYFVNGETVKEICAKNNISYHKFKYFIHIILTKLKKQL